MTCGIYLISHKPSGRKYVGQSVDIESRVRDDLGGSAKSHEGWVFLGEAK